MPLQKSLAYENFRFLSCPQLRCDLRLIGIEFARPTEADATVLCCLAAGTGPLTDQISLELGDAGQRVFRQR